MEDGHRFSDPCQGICSGHDSHERWGFFAIFDGHGGREEVAHCEECLQEVISEELRRAEALDAETVRESLTEAFRRVDVQLRALGARESGCTATVALTRRKADTLTVYVANVGDSRALAVGSHGTRRLSSDHRASNPAEAERVKLEGGFIHHRRVSGKLSVSRSLGDHGLKPGVSNVPDFHTFVSDKPFTLVMATDGLWDVVDDDEVQEILEEIVSTAIGANTECKAVADMLRSRAASALVERALRRGSKDNILATVIFS